MTAVFLDTHYLLALVNTLDAYHRQAEALRPRYQQGLVTTEFVLLEVLDALTVGGQRSVALALVDLIRTSPGIEIVPLSPSVFQRGLDLFAARPDKEWGITDCISFVIMQERRMADALTGDRHFEQAGFHALLRHPSEHS